MLEPTCFGAILNLWIKIHCCWYDFTWLNYLECFNFVINKISSPCVSTGCQWRESNPGPGEKMPPVLHSPHRVEISSESKTIVLKYDFCSYCNNQSLKQSIIKTINH